VEVLAQELLHRAENVRLRLARCEADRQGLLSAAGACHEALRAVRVDPGKLGLALPEDGEFDGTLLGFIDVDAVATLDARCKQKCGEASVASAALTVVSRSALQGIAEGRQGPESGSSGAAGSGSGHGSAARLQVLEDYGAKLMRDQHAEYATMDSLRRKLAALKEGDPAAEPLRAQAKIAEDKVAKTVAEAQVREGNRKSN
jgi:hypothetical protein